MKKIVLDIETQNTFREVGSSDPAALDLSLLVIYDFETDAYQSFLKAELPKLWKVLEQTDLIIGFNLEEFDIPVLNKYYPGDLTKIKNLDLLKEVRKALGKRVSLDMLSEGTLNKNKLTHGLQAVKWWQEGEIDKIREYCEEDVRITKELYEYALQNGHLKYKIIDEVFSFPIVTDGWEGGTGAKMNYTLPF